MSFARREMLKLAAISPALLISNQAFEKVQPQPVTAKVNMENLTLSERMMHATVRLVCPTGPQTASVGSGFIYAFPIDKDRVFLTVITNKHVLNGFPTCLFQLTAMKSDGTADYGKNHTIEMDDLPKNYFPHPDKNIDLAAMPIGWAINQLQAKGTPPFFTNLDKSIIPSYEAMKELEPLQSIVTIGYPEGLIDYVNNLPIFHRGAAATPPYIDYQGRPDFLIDIATWPGSSGSPVFLYDEGMIYDPRKHIATAGERVMLLGVIYQDYEKDPTSGEMKLSDIPSSDDGKIRNPINIGMCVKSKCILGFEPIIAKVK